MVTTIQSAFDGLRSSLEITGLQSTLVSVRQQNVRKVIQASMEVLDDFQTGSYARSTMIAPLKEADIDILVVFDVKYYPMGPAGLLDATKRALKKTYTSTPDISRNGQAVTIRFTDFVVDVVTGFYRTGGGYLIANSITNSWLETDPKAHVKIFSEANKAHGGKLVPLIKMLKGWNKSHGSFFRSFHIEVLAREILHNVRITDYPSGVRFFFDKARSVVKGKNFDPAGYGDDIGSYINTPAKLEEAIRRLQTAHDQCLRAEQFALRGQIRDSVDAWRRVFSDYFPAYG